MVRENVHDPVGISPHELKFSKKFKLFGITEKSKSMTFSEADTRLCISDFYQVELEVEPRTMTEGEIPPMGPLLWEESTGPISHKDRCTFDNPEYAKDPFFLCELYDTVRTQFKEMVEQRKQANEAAVASGREETEYEGVTIRTPVNKNSSTFVRSFTNAATTLTFRFSTEYEYIRFVYICELVLGYDKIITLPYRGLPPKDPRNGCAFGHVPMNIRSGFLQFEKVVFYSFMKGNLLGPSNDGSTLAVTFKNVYCVVTHDMVYFIRRDGRIPRWVQMVHVTALLYNYQCSMPYFVILSDPPYSSFIFVPTQPRFGAIKKPGFDARAEVLRMRQIHQDVCYSSITVRRVGLIDQIDMGAVAFYLHRKEIGEPLQLVPSQAESSSSEAVMHVTMCKEQLGTAWQQVQDIANGITPQVPEGRAAVPLYESVARNMSFTATQLRNLERRLDNMRMIDDGIVGMSLEQIQRLQAAEAARSGESVGADANDSSRSPSEESDGEYQYTSEYARYYTVDEVGEEGLGFVDAHVEITSPMLCDARNVFDDERLLADDTEDESEEGVTNTSNLRHVPTVDEIYDRSYTDYCI